MVVEAIRLVVGDDDGALRPVRAVGDVVDRPGRERLGDLLIRVSGVIVVPDERVLDRGVGSTGTRPSLLSYPPRK